MSEILTRTYTYTGKSSWTTGESSVALSSFEVSGDTRPVTQVLSISASWYRRQATSSAVTHTAELVFSDGTTLKSSAVSKRGDGQTFLINTDFVDMPSSWNADSITMRTTLNTKLKYVSWIATSSQPMKLTITYLSSEFKPSITNAKLYRASSTGAALDSGTCLSFKATLSVEKTGTGGSGTFTIYSGDSASTTTTPKYSKTEISGSTDGVTISAGPTSGFTTTVDSGAKKWFRMEFSYTATSNNVESTETVSVTFLITNVFTNVHLAGKKKGGVAFGKYSASTDDTPMFECDYPAYFLKGIEMTSGGIEKRTLAFDADAPFVVRADNPLQPTLRRFGHVIELHGEIQPKQSISGSTTYYPICTLPTAYAPHHDITVLQQGSDQSIWMLRIFKRDHAERPCKVMFARYRSGGSWENTTTNTWLPFHATWIV